MTHSTNFVELGKREKDKICWWEADILFLSELGHIRTAQVRKVVKIRSGVVSEVERRALLRQWGSGKSTYVTHSVVLRCLVCKLE